MRTQNQTDEHWLECDRARGVDEASGGQNLDRMREDCWSQVKMRQVEQTTRKNRVILMFMVD